MKILMSESALEGKGLIINSYDCDGNQVLADVSLFRPSDDLVAIDKFRNELVNPEVIARLCEQSGLSREHFLPEIDAFILRLERLTIPAIVFSPVPDDFELDEEHKTHTRKRSPGRPEGDDPDRRHDIH